MSSSSSDDLFAAESSSDDDANNKTQPNTTRPGSDNKEGKSQSEISTSLSKIKDQVSQNAATKKDDKDNDDDDLFNSQGSDASSHDHDDDNVGHVEQSLVTRGKDDFALVEFGKSKEKEILEPLEAIKLKIPEINKLLPFSDLKYCKLPPSIHIAPQMFNQKSYDEDKEKEELKGLGKDLVGDNVIRWRYKRDIIGDKILNEKTGKYEIESNAKFVQWDDGSMQLFIGKEAFDVIENPVTNQTMMLYAATKDEVTDSTVMEAIGRISENMNLRPTSLFSSAHKDLEMKVKGKNLRTIKMKVTESMNDPESYQSSRAKARDDTLRTVRRTKRSSTPGVRSKARWSEAYLEGAANRERKGDEEEHEQYTSVSKIKSQVRSKQRKSTGGGTGHASDSFLSSSENEKSDSENDEYFGKDKEKKASKLSRRRTRGEIDSESENENRSKKKKKVSNKESDNAEDNESDEDDEDFESSDESESPENTRSKRKSHVSDEEDEEVVVNAAPKRKIVVESDSE